MKNLIFLIMSCVQQMSNMCINYIYILYNIIA